jgi:hypothetical protein
MTRPRVSSYGAPDHGGSLMTKTRSLSGYSTTSGIAIVETSTKRVGVPDSFDRRCAPRRPRRKADVARSELVRRRTEQLRAGRFREAAHRHTVVLEVRRAVEEIGGHGLHPMLSD